MGSERSLHSFFRLSLELESRVGLFVPRGGGGSTVTSGVPLESKSGLGTYFSTRKRGDPTIVTSLVPVGKWVVCMYVLPSPLVHPTSFLRDYGEDRYHQRK